VPLPPQSSHYEALKSHVKFMEEALEAARSVAHVAIVTLALRPWVHTSAERYLPGCMLDDLLTRLDNTLDDQNLGSPTDESRKSSVESSPSSRRRKKATRANVLSVGDSNTEKDAIMEVLWNLSEDGTETPLCKTVKMADQPAVQLLSDQLTILSQWIPGLAAQNEDLDINMEDPQDLQHWSQIMAATSDVVA